MMGGLESTHCVITCLTSQAIRSRLSTRAASTPPPPPTPPDYPIPSIPTRTTTQHLPTQPDRHPSRQS